MFRGLLFLLFVMRGGARTLQRCAGERERSSWAAFTHMTSRATNSTQPCCPPLQGLWGG